MAEGPAKKRNIGRRQQARYQGHASSSGGQPKGNGISFFEGCTTGMWAFKKWARGLLHSTEVQEMCHNAHQYQVALLTSLGICTSNVDQRLEAIARLGSWGQNKGNINRYLLRLIGTPDTCPDPIMIPTKCYIQKPDEGMPRIQAVEILFCHSIWFCTNCGRRGGIVSANCS